jgi:ligand-binding SRPBCC domain-containing protein
MNFQIRTPVGQDYRQVWLGFNRDLFSALAPPFPPVRLLRFDGSLRGDEVHLELNFVFFRQLWVSLITDQHEGPTEIYFVDEGTKLPFFLKSWRHRHGIVRAGTGAVIIDDITFQSPGWLPSFLLFPTLYLQFWYRKPIYRRLFGPSGPPLT